MFPGRTTIESPPQLMQGWLASLALHGFLLGMIILSVHQSPITLPTERFQWDVSLVQSAQLLESSPPATNTVAQPIQEMPTPPSTATHRSPRTVTPYNKTFGTGHPVVDHTGIEKPSPITDQTESPSNSTPADQAPRVPPTTDGTSQPTVAQADLHSEDSPKAEATTASASTIPDPIPSSVDPSGTPAAASPPVETVSAPRADYRWLQQAIFRRLEDLKRSSRPQLDGLQPLKVLVKAVVSIDGNLLASEIVRSSGLPHIDQEAMALVQRAFPMQFERPLDRQQVAMRIPITYSRE